MKGHTSMIQAIDIRDDLLISGDVKGGIYVWNLNKVLAVADTASHEAGARVTENAQWTAMASLGTGLGLRALSFTIGGDRIISLGYDLSRPNSDQGRIVSWEIP